MRRMRRTLALTSFAAVLAVLCHTTDAQAVHFKDLVSNLEIEVGAKGASTCVLLPSSLTQGESCRGIDVASAAKKVVSSVKGRVSLAAFVHFGDWGFIMLVSTIEQKGIGEMTSEEIPRFAALTAEDMSRAVGSKVSVHGDSASSPADLTMVNGVHALRWHAETAFPGTERVVTYDLFERDRYHAVTFVTDPSHVTEVRSHAAETMKSLSMPAVKLDRFGKSAKQLEQAAASGLRLTPLLLILGVASLIGVFLVIRRKRA